jgi:type I restriction enzyme S subunit
VNALGAHPLTSKRLKYVVSLRRSRTDGGEDSGPYIGLENIGSWTGRLVSDTREIDAVSPSAETEGESLSSAFAAGDVLFGKLRPYLAKTYLAEFRGRCTTELLVMQPVGVEARFLRYICLWRGFVDAVDASTFGSKMPRADWDFIGNMPVPIPERSQQQGIADYLDQETVRLDALSSAKERLLNLLAEKRRAIIARAVTRGLNPHVPHRDSGIPWLGEIPAHWQTVRAKWLFRERDQRSATGEEELLTVSHITGVTPRSEKDVNMFEAETTEGYKICAARDLVINTLWAWMGAMGVARVDGIVSPAYNVYEPGPQLEPGYVDALVRLPVFAQEVTRYSKGVWSSRLRLYPEGFFETVLPVPPVEEQAGIVASIAAETARLDGLSAATERTIALLKERRAALICAAVTGAIDLRNAGSTGTVETPPQ